MRGNIFSGLSKPRGGVSQAMEVYQGLPVLGKMAIGCTLLGAAWESRKVIKSAFETALLELESIKQKRYGKTKP